MRIAITRSVPESLPRCELTHLERVPIDYARACVQHSEYEEAIRSLGCMLRHAPAAHDLPDSVFVEDVAIVLDEIAIVTRPGAESRRPERAGVAAILEEFRPLRAIEAPGTLDGGDVLRLGKTLYVGLSTRTNREGADQLRQLASALGYRVECLETVACLHLKSAVTAVHSDRVLANPAWVEGLPMTKPPPCTHSSAGRSDMSPLPMPKRHNGTSAPEIGSRSTSRGGGRVFVASSMKRR